LRFLTVPFAVLGLAASPGAGQDLPLPDLFSDTIDVRVINVEVVVTDRDGNRVRGLQVGDFELLVDGEPVPIGYFTEIDEGVARGARAEADKAEDGGLQAVPSLAPDEPVRTNYLLFIDEFFAIRRDRDRVLKRLERDLAQLGAHDRMAVVAFDGRNVARLTDWTGARDELRDAFREARKREALGIMRRADIDPAATAPDSPGAAASGPLAQNTLDGVESAPALNSVRRTATALNLSKREREIQRSVLAATATVRSFADPPGRKAMLVLTDGWEAPGFNNPDPFGPPPPSIESIYGPLVHAANRLGYTLYPVDLAGLNPRFANSSFGIGDVSVGYNAGAGASSAAAQSSPFAAPQGLNLEWSQDAAFGYLAHETGGLPMINAFRDIALAEAATDTRHYYWLGFEPPRNQDDELHDIEIRLAGHPDLQVRSRQSMAATASIRSLADVPGRKAMLLLVETFCSPSRSWQFSSFWEDGTCRKDTGSMYQPLVTAANRVGYTIYPVDMAGLRPTFGIDPATGGLMPDNPEIAQEAALWFLAHETGGKPLINFYRKVALAETAVDTRSFYWLGFNPSGGDDDALHDIEVRLPRHGDLRVRSRQHYRDLSRSTEFTLLVEGSLMFGGLPGKDVLEVHFGTPRKAGFRKFLVPTWVTIPVDDLTLLPVDGQWTNDVEFRISVVDRYGGHSKSLGSRIPIRYSEAPPPGETFVYETELPIRKGMHRFLAALYDPLTGEILARGGTVGPR